MNILFIGDIFASVGRRLVEAHLQEIISRENIDLAMANAENAAGGFGITPSVADELLLAGARRAHHRQSHLGQEGDLRFPAAPRTAAASRELSRRTAGRRPVRHPRAKRRALRRNEPAGPNVSSQHRLPVPQGRSVACVAARRTSRCASWISTPKSPAKKWRSAGISTASVSALIGTHTHVPTADSRILPGGTAYQTDAGMTGPYDSIIGVKKDPDDPSFPHRPASADGSGQRHA